MPISQEDLERFIREPASRFEQKFFHRIDEFRGVLFHFDLLPARGGHVVQDFQIHRLTLKNMEDLQPLRELRERALFNCLCRHFEGARWVGPTYWERLVSREPEQIFPFGLPGEPYAD